MKTLEDLRNTEFKAPSLLDGEEHETRRFIITCGQTMASRNVMFVMYSVPKVYNRYAKDTYLGLLAIDFDQAVINARKKIKHYKIDIDVSEVYGARRESSTFPFGKYRGKTAAEVFDIDPRYLFWAANKMHVRSSKLRSELAEYGELSKILIVNENRAKSNPALPIDAKKVTREMTITFVKEVEYGYLHRLCDAENNLYQYTGKELGAKGETITLPCKVTRNFTSMGKNINKINLR